MLGNLQVHTRMRTGKMRLRCRWGVCAMRVNVVQKEFFSASADANTTGLRKLALHVSADHLIRYDGWFMNEWHYF